MDAYGTIGTILNNIRTEEYICIVASPETIKVVYDMWPDDLETVFQIGKNAFDMLIKTNPEIPKELNKMGEDKKTFTLHRCNLSLQQSLQKAIAFFYEKQYLNIESSIEQFSSDMQVFGAKFRYLLPFSRVWDLKCLLNTLAKTYVGQCVEQNGMQSRFPTDDSAFLDSLRDVLSHIVNIMRIHMAFGYDYIIYRPIEDEIRVIGQNKNKMVPPGITAAGSFVELAQQLRTKRNNTHNFNHHHSEPLHLSEIMFELTVKNN